MTSTEQLILGYISYLNCTPFFQYLRDEGYKGRLVAGVPSALNRMLQEGQLDASPSSSFEYALHADKYCLLPGFSISSQGPVNSVLLFSPVPPEQLVGRKIALTSESATSINLLRVLLLEFYGHNKLCDYTPIASVEEEIAKGQPGLLIGDRAMTQALQVPEGVRVYDLGAMWYEKTGLPFVFALWILRRDSAHGKADLIRQVIGQLDKALQRSLQDLDQLAIVAGFSGDDITYCSNYWRGIDYTLTTAHRQGLELFFELCSKHGLLQKSPELIFF